MISEKMFPNASLYFSIPMDTNQNFMLVIGALIWPPISSSFATHRFYSLGSCKMHFVNDVNELLKILKIAAKQPYLIAIDGRPCAGKSTLADTLSESFNAKTVFLDDFFVPPSLWPADIKPSFPFPFFRNEEFIQAVKMIASGHPAKYRPWNWQRLTLDDEKEIRPNGVVIIEGVSVLRAELSSSYDLKIFVASDRKSEFDAIFKRESPQNLSNWVHFYLPSIELYWKTEPWKNADVLLAGRGISNKSEIMASLEDISNTARAKKSRTP